jgi:hypothetical protein
MSLMRNGALRANMQIDARISGISELGLACIAADTTFI